MHPTPHSARGQIAARRVLATCGDRRQQSVVSPSLRQGKNNPPQPTIDPTREGETRVETHTPTAALLLPTVADGAVSDAALNQAATSILSAYTAGRIDDTQTANSLWTWASQAAQIDTAVRVAIRRCAPHHVSTSSVTEAVRTHVHELIHSKLVNQWRSPGGFDPHRAGNFAGWVRNLTVTALRWHGGRIIEAHARQVPVDSQETHPLDLLTIRHPRVTGTGTPAHVSDPLDLVTAAETGLADLHADVWTDVTLKARKETPTAHHPMLFRQVYSASYRVPPPARPLEPETRQALVAALGTDCGKEVCLAVLRHKAVRATNGTPDAYGWDDRSLSLAGHRLSHLFQALWAPLDPLSAARLGEDRDLACWYAEAATYLLPHRGAPIRKRFISKVRSLSSTAAEKGLLEQMAQSWLAVEVEAVSPWARRTTAEQIEQAQKDHDKAAAAFEDVLASVVASPTNPLGRHRTAVLRYLRLLAVEVGVIDSNPLTAHRDLGRLIQDILDDCPLVG